ncbi:TolC family protein [Massilia forsythiae]|uniref:TolC family protein n=1 Tax=Massilia forsythiae TaxID=2728020 RepID=A0A7Z2VUS8_9BURK|nr:TolC family protein [Massilia forsythiae]QJD99842.1 TolC family protein [Massilia forsythiae]
MHTLSKRLSVLVVVSALAWRCGAAEPLHGTTAGNPPLDLPTAIRLALDQPGPRAAAHDVAASEALVDQANRFPNPELQYLREGQQTGTRTTTVQINQPIELGGKRGARVAAAQSAVDLANSELMARRQDVRSDVIAVFYEVLVAQRRQELARALTELARKSVEVASKRVIAGKVSPIDETKARLAAVDASTELNQAAAALAIARTKLAALIGQPAGALVLVEQPDALPDVRPLDALQARAKNAAIIRRVRSQVSAQEAQVDVERAARIPDLTLSVGTQRDDQVGRRQTVLGLSVPLPLFNRNSDALRAAMRRTDKARDELAATEISTASELATAYTRYEVARNEATLLRQDVVPNARSAYDLTLKGFEYGKFSFLEVLDAQRTWFQAQSRQWNSTLEAWRAFADIERIAGPAEPNN